MNLKDLTIKKAHKGLIKKEFSSTELTKAYLEQIKKVDKDVKAFITVTEKEALNQAEKVDQKIAQGDSISELAGIPYAAKDLFCTQGIKTTAGSKILENFISPYESTTTQRLSEQDAVLIGKTNLDEFAMGSSTENSSFFVTKNPHDKTRVPGGTSGGSAASVSADEVIYAVATDTGGSIRQPASFCGVVGLKVTYGRTSRYGVVAYASSLDTIGHLTKNVEDSAIVLQAIAGKDEHDSTTSNIALDNYEKELKKDIKGVKIGIPKGYLEMQGLNPKVKFLIEKGIKRIEELTGEKAREIELMPPDYALACYYIIMPSEVSSNLARYDGIKYGLSEKTENLLKSYLKTRAKGFGDEVKRRIILGTFTLSHGYYDAYYKKAQAVRASVIQSFKKAFDQIDVIIMPTAPGTAFKIGEKTNDLLQMYLEDLYTIPASLAGLPALSVPCGKVNNLPVGLQIIGNWFDEKSILRLAHHFEVS
ncbi:MAG: Asp-tRNA(Asn)/Glu-tRNA(Gln) amidotransferase subunit GatA [Candidatus Kuenenbacteria bacterium]